MTSVNCLSRNWKLNGFLTQLTRARGKAGWKVWERELGQRNFQRKQRAA